MSLIQKEHKLLCLFATLSEDDQLWIMAKCLEFSKELPSDALRESVIARHSSVEKFGQH
jgi:hypothetical protein